MRVEFNEEYAKKHGIVAAIVYHEVMVTTNKTSKGLTRTSAAELHKYLPIFSLRTIQRALHGMVMRGEVDFVPYHFLPEHREATPGYTISRENWNDGTGTKQ